MVGKAIADRRDDLVLSTKVYSPMGDARHHQVGARRWLVTKLDTRLRCINADHINLEIAGRKLFL